jgi:hypothetical protein
VVGSLNSRSADIVSSFTGSDFPGFPGSRPSAHRLEPPPPCLLPTCDCGTIQTRVRQDPRYWQQLFRRSPAKPQEEELDGALTSQLQPVSNASLQPNHKLKRDWSEDMGTGATVGAGQYPGKFAFDVTTYSCTTDFVVFNTSLAGSSGQASIIAYNNLYHGCGERSPPCTGRMIRVAQSAPR